MSPMIPTRRVRRHSRLYPFRRAVLGGLGVVLPPLLTVVIFLWIAGTIQQYALEPVTIGARNALAWYWTGRDEKLLSVQPIATELQGNPAAIVLPSGDVYQRLEGGIYIPDYVREAVARDDPARLLKPTNRKRIYQRYAEVETLRPQMVVPLFLSVFILFLYLLGKFLGAGVGRVFWNLFEWGVHRVPLVRNVYDSVKQVTDFMIKEPEIEYTRVVAVEYPRKGCWSLGFVTGESLRDIRNAAGEPVLSVMIPSSPMSVTGYTITALKSLTVDLDLTVDQALQFVISCGVVLPAHQIPHDRLAAASPANQD
ncbi:MAG TPA: DUF502 domain-containing protein [Pirellulales bacterium]|nr:DUF502 domain-containing protein [Pirellulales bacterium]